MYVTTWLHGFVKACHIYMHQPTHTCNIIHVVEPKHGRQWCNMTCSGTLSAQLCWYHHKKTKPCTHSRTTIMLRQLQNSRMLFIIAKEQHPGYILPASSPLFPSYFCHLMSIYTNKMYNSKHIYMYMYCACTSLSLKGL